MLLTSGVIGGMDCEVGPTNSFAVTLDALLQPPKFGAWSPASKSGAALLWHVHLPVSRLRCAHLKTIRFIEAKNKCVFEFDSDNMVVCRSFSVFDGLQSRWEPSGDSQLS